MKTSNLAAVAGLMLAFALVVSGCAPAVQPSQPNEVPTEAPIVPAEETEAPAENPTPVPEEDPTPAPTDDIALTTFSTPIPGAKYTLENFPVVDGSLANVPMVNLLTMRMLGVDEDTAAAITASHFSNTNPSYMALCDGQVQLVLAYEPSSDTVAYMQESNVKLEQTEIGRDALVFLTGKSNPVESLTLEQVQAIYSGQITNWKEVGGNDEPIIAYQRREDSGSQTLMRKLVMKDTPMMAPPQEYVVEEMGELIDVVSQFDGDNNALGFSVYYYVANMYGNENIKMIPIDGVMPSNETIENGQYGLVNPFYATIRQDAGAESAEREIYNWLQTEEGTQLIREAGYVPAGTR